MIAGVGRTRLRNRNDLVGAFFCPLSAIDGHPGHPRTLVRSRGQHVAQSDPAPPTTPLPAAAREGCGGARRRSEVRAGNSHLRATIGGDEMERELMTGTAPLERIV